jgi:hypothetical protein
MRRNPEIDHLFVHRSCIEGFFHIVAAMGWCNQHLGPVYSLANNHTGRWVLLESNNDTNALFGFVDPKDRAWFVLAHSHAVVL